MLDKAKLFKHKIFMCKKIFMDLYFTYNEYFKSISANIYPGYYSQENRMHSIGAGTKFPSISTLHLDSSFFSVDNNQYRTIPDAPKRLFLVWSGDNELPDARQDSLNAIIKFNKDIETVVITPQNLFDWVLPDYPLHDSYQSLSYVHRSDYLRAYLMHHWGGAYMDIKKSTTNWELIIDMLNSSSDYWVAGPHEYSSNNLGVDVHHKVHREMRRNFSKILAQYAFACKPYSPFTQEWINEVHRRLNYLGEDLTNNPANGALGDYPRYPVPWNFLLGQFFSHLGFKYQRNIFIIDDFSMILRDHR